MTQSNIDCLLLKLARTADDPWRYVARLQDVSLALPFVLDCGPRWPSAVCRAVLSAFVSRQRNAAAADWRRARSMLDRLELYEEIRSRDLGPWPDWQALDAARQSDVAAVAQRLLAASELALADRWARACESKTTEQLVQEHSLRAILDSGDTVRAHRVLERMPRAVAPLVCEAMLARLPNHATKLFLVQFMLESLRGHLSLERVDELQRLELGLLMLQCLPEQMQSVFEHLVTRPRLMLEQLLMNAMLDVAAKMLADVPDGEDTSLFFVYAAKALEFPSVSSGHAAAAAAAAIPTGPTPGSRGSRAGSLSATGAVAAGGARSTAAAAAAAESMADTAPLASSSATSGASVPETASQSSGAAANDVPEFRITPQSAWARDDDTIACQECFEMFTFFNRRHHCRVCGRLLCGTCSAQQLMLPELGAAPVRSCERCVRLYRRWTARRASGVGTSAPALPPQPQQQQQSATATSTDVRAVKQLRWRLGNDEVADTAVRRRFSFGRPGHTSLCVAILDLYSDASMAGRACLRLCDVLSQRLVSDPAGGGLGPGGEEVDLLLVISMIQRLSFYAKLKFMKAGAHGGVEQCDMYIGRADLMRQLFSAQYRLQLSIGDFDDLDKARRLRDKLIDDDRMELAMEVATKCRLDAGTVWMAWGMQKLRCGAYEEAREKFRHCLAPRDRGVEPGSAGAATAPSAAATAGDGSGGEAAREGLMLARVIEAVEARAPLRMANVKTLQKLLLAKRDAGGRDASLEQSIDSLLTPSPTDAAGRGALGVKGGRRSMRVSIENSLDHERLDECMYYLTTYGTPGAMLNFLIRHGLMDRACHLVLTRHLEPEIFYRDLFTVALDYGRLAALKRAISDLDPTLEQWDPYLMYTCRMLNRHEQLPVLYDIQLFLKDLFRAALTSVKMSMNTGLSVDDRIGLLKQAAQHFRNGLMYAKQAIGGLLVSPPSRASRMMLPADEVQRYLDTIALQSEVLWLAAAEPGSGAVAADAAESDPAARAAAAAQLARTCVDGSMSLFGPEAARLEIASLLLRCGHVDLAARIATLLKLDTKRLFVQAARGVAHSMQPGVLDRLLEHARRLLPAADVDALLLTVIEMFAVQQNNVRLGEQYIVRLTHDESRIAGLILCGKLKAAYLLAVKLHDADAVRRISEAAIRAGPEQRGIVDLCERYLRTPRPLDPH